MIRQNFSLFIVLAAMAVLAFLLQLMLGSVFIPPTEVLKIIAGRTVESEIWKNIVLESRLPGAMAAMLAGAGLSVSGLQMQTMFRNPVAGPYVLGISAGASLGVAVLLLAGGFLGFTDQMPFISSGGVIMAAAMGSISIFLINIIISHRIRDVVAILIIGLMVGGGISALIEILQSVSGSEALKQYVLWTFGSFRYINTTQILYLLIVVVAGLAFSMILSKQLNMLLLGETYAESMGLNIRRSKIYIVLCTSVLAGGITAFCGPIGFVGLAVPHIARTLFKTADHKVLTPACAITGAVVCSACNIVAGMPGSDSILPINAVTSLIGAPFVIWIILKQKRLT